MWDHTHKEEPKKYFRNFQKYIFIYIDYRNVHYFKINFHDFSRPENYTFKFPWYLGFQGCGNAHWPMEKAICN